MKLLVFFAALFPQFISADAAFWPQFLILSATYIVIDGCFLSAYGLGASWVAARFKGAAKVWIERAGVAFMSVAAVLLGLKSVTLDATMLATYDSVLVATAHSEYDFDFIVQHAPMVIDTRNATAGVTQGREKIFKA